MLRLPIFGKALLPLLLVATVACDATPPPVGLERGAELFETCAPCHGDAGVGKVDIAAPAIAGLPQWYVEDQLRGFQNEYRGDHADDLPGMRMRPMAVSLTRDGDVESVAQYVASLEPVYPQSTLHGDAGAGAASMWSAWRAMEKTAWQQRSACSSHSPIRRLVSPHPLRNFKSGARGARTDDIWGQTMRVNSLALTDEGMQDVIAYVQTLR